MYRRWPARRRRHGHLVGILAAVGLAVSAGCAAPGRDGGAGVARGARGDRAVLDRIDLTGASDDRRDAGPAPRDQLCQAPVGPERQTPEDLLCVGTAAEAHPLLAVEGAARCGLHDDPSRWAHLLAQPAVPGEVGSGAEQLSLEALESRHGSLVAVAEFSARALQDAVNGWMGTPYRLGGDDHSGIDCSAFVQAVFREALNVELPRRSDMQFEVGVRISQRSLRPGDLVFFDTLERGGVSHVGVYLGDGVFAHASASRGVTLAHLQKSYFQRVYRGSRRIIQH